MVPNVLDSIATDAAMVMLYSMNEMSSDSPSPLEKQ
jgi:hypothetical protein